MTNKASAGSALLFAAGLLISLAGPAPAIAASEDSASAASMESAISGESGRHGKRHYRNHSRSPSKLAEGRQPAEGQQAGENQVADASKAIPPGMPDWLSNANAQMTATDAAPDSARGLSAAMPDKASTVLPTATEQPAQAEAPSADAAGVVASDQLNDSDRTLQEASSAAPATQGVVLASTSRAASEAASNDSSTLDRTSLIGKIFIAVGALLTVASAARMFMA
jgi:hypothetical protein